LEPPRTLAPRVIKLSFTQVDGERIDWTIQNSLKAERDNQGVKLFFYIEEEGGERFVFERLPGRPSAQAPGK
jgi:hypothetical protein